MQLFVDILGTSGTYRAANDPSWVDPAMPTCVMTGTAFLEAAGEHSRQIICALYHVERSEFLTVRRFSEAQVMELDTIVIVNSDDARFLGERAVDRLWWNAGCAQRRLACGGMPFAERAALSLYAN